MSSQSTPPNADKQSRRTPPQPVDTVNVPGALLKKPTVEVVTGLSGSTIDRKVKDGTFPAPVKLGSRCTRWPADAVREWLAKKAHA
jgi:prophage regulatory protein